MQHQAPADAFACLSSARRLSFLAVAFPLFRLRLFRLELIFSGCHFDYQIEFPQFQQHFEQGFSLVFRQVEPLRHLHGGNAILPNLQETQYVIGTERCASRHNGSR